ncbi:MAG: hypothetical protein EAZ39_24885 [Oscillatoriales cyanobacterium]|uniref:hypothetical protein n=1 Tax=Microcoleus TaxID=44471 RepID=UPI001E0C2EE4|nr:hypothetical protein [Microcoleus sp. PH2017_05_CCC_O_A]MCC3437907.1 hypothetical protein [Microcoleus sp. PH2017_05_CCC_O_A]TAG03459.1 MAG: hypothetical protein EAZ45_09770 [Oscillatoriales cyanobacterium]TAG14373.1 MAG: hypothetical protein EAZ39_24885 [Oscillatoriales cyanobacterium]
MDLTVKNLVLSYETLANQSVKLNQSYLSLLKVYDELNFDISLLADLDQAGCSPLKVVESMNRDQLIIVDKFTDLIGLISNAQKHFVSGLEAKKLSETAHDCLVMRDFVKGIALNQLQQMFTEISLS